MRIWIDCEWNSYGGELISIALVAENGSELYLSLGCSSPHPWVAENVMPHLPDESVSMEFLQGAIERFICNWSSVEIIADWPEDIAYFCKAIIVGPGERIILPDVLTFRVVDLEIPTGMASRVPHHALWDARSIRDAMLAAEKS